MDDWDERTTDPYIGQKNKLTIPSDEDTSGGLGTRFRGESSPKNFSEESESLYEKQRKDDIPGEEVIMDMPPSTGIPPGALADPSDPISENYRIMDQLSEPKQTPIGPFNMPHGFVKKKPVFNRLTDDVFDYVLRNKKG